MKDNGKNKEQTLTLSKVMGSPGWWHSYSISIWEVGRRIPAIKGQSGLKTKTNSQTKTKSTSKQNIEMRCMKCDRVK